MHHPLAQAPGDAASCCFPSPVCWLLRSSPAGSSARGGARRRGPFKGDLPAVHPVPQHAVSQSGESVPLTGRVHVVAAPETDQPALDALLDVIAAAGGTAEVVAALDKPSEGSSAVYLGLGGEASPARSALRDLGTERPEDGEALDRAEGYVVATGKLEGIPTAVLVGHDGDGVFHSVQTLRQLLKAGSVPALHVSDWPLMETRGVIEGFYGTPWSHQARLDVISFAGRQKMNTYIYSPKDDPLLREKWRDLYSGSGTHGTPGAHRGRRGQPSQVYVRALTGHRCLLLPGFGS